MPLNEFEQKVQNWLDTPSAERNLEIGATLMLQANRNRILHQNVIKRANFGKIEYELRKFLPLNKASVTGSSLNKAAEITTLETKAFKISKNMENPLRGKRADHDSLPTDIQNIVEVNTVIYHEMRSIHEKLKVLSADNYDAAKRKPLLDNLIAKQDKINSNWKLYDAFDPTKPIATKSEKEVDFKRINSNRVYLSRALKSIDKKLKEGKTDQAQKQIDEAKIRYNELIAAGMDVEAEMIQKLKTAGVIK